LKIVNRDKIDPGFFISLRQSFFQSIKKTGKEKISTGSQKID